MTKSFDIDASDILALLVSARTAEISPGELYARWQVSVLSVTCADAAHRCADPVTPKRVWGAVQTALHSVASREARTGERCPWQPPSAYDLMHNEWGTHGDGRGIPKPFTISVSPSGSDMVVSVLLFGAACMWRGEVASALVAGLRRGIDGRAGGASQEITARTIAEPCTVAPLPEQTGPIVLRFLTPVSVREGDRDHWAPFGIIKSIIGRVSGMARWHGLSLQTATPALLDEATIVAAQSEWPAPEQAVLTSGAGKGARRGATGDLVLPSTSSDLAAVLALGSLTHAGARAAEGRGRYEIIFT